MGIPLLITRTSRVSRHTHHPHTNYTTEKELLSSAGGEDTQNPAHSGDHEAAVHRQSPSLWAQSVTEDTALD